MNLKTKTNTVKQILAKVMLVVVLLTSILSLSGCEWENIFTSTTEDVDGGYGCIVNDGWRRDDFETLNDSINKKVPDEYYFVTFNFDNKEDYVVNPYYVFLKAILSGLNDRDCLWKTCYIEGSAEIGGPEEENCIKIKYVSFVLEDIDLSDTSLLQIKVLPDKMEGAKIGHYMYYGVYVGENKLMEFSIKSTSKKLSEEEFSQICDDLRKCLVVIG